MRLGTVDASVVAAAERLGITAIATLDRRHFSVVRPRHVEAFALPMLRREPGEELIRPGGAGRPLGPLTYTRSRVPDAAPLREQLAGLPDGSRRLHLPRRRRPGALRRQGEVDPAARALLLPGPAAARRGRRRGGRMSARGGLHPKIDDLVERIDRVEVFVTGSESEALILEANLVKRHRPPFNVRLRDDKSYPYIGISLDEEYPRVYFTRERHRRDRLYFGPFSNAYKVRETLNLIGKIFPQPPVRGAASRAGPRASRASTTTSSAAWRRASATSRKEDYRALIDQIIAFLSGRYRGLERELERARCARPPRRRSSSARRAVRNRLSAVRHLMERQFATAGSVGTADVLGVAIEGDSANVQVLQVRDGVLQDRQSFFLDTAGRRRRGHGARCSSPTSTTRWRWRSRRWSWSRRAARPRPTSARCCPSAAGSRVEVRAAARGDKRKLAELAERNARFALDQDRRRHEQARVAAPRRAGRPPGARSSCRRRRCAIECYDISNLGETYAVASMVVFEGGAPAKAHYRTFTMRYEGGPDDFARMEEAVAPPLRPACSRGEDDPSLRRAARAWSSSTAARASSAAALAGMRRAGVDDVPVVSAWPSATRRSSARAGRSRCCSTEGSAALRCSSTIRDEAHRFALRHHRGRRDRGMTASVLDAPARASGPARKAAILRHFGSPERFLAASREELEAVPGVPPKVARDVYDRLHKTAGPREGAAPVPAAVAAARRRGWS